MGIIRQLEQLITFTVSRMKVFIALCLCFILVELAMSSTKEQGTKDRTGQVVATVEAFQKLGCRLTCQTAGYASTTWCRVGLLKKPCNLIFPAAGIVAGIVG